MGEIIIKSDLFQLYLSCEFLVIGIAKGVIALLEDFWDILRIMFEFSHSLLVKLC